MHNHSAIVRTTLTSLVVGHRVGLAVAFDRQAPARYAVARQVVCDGLSPRLRKPLIVCRTAGRVGVPADFAVRFAP